MIAHLDLRLEDCDAEVWLNDIPIHRVNASGTSAFVTKPVNEFIQQGENVLMVVPYSGATPSGARTSRTVVSAPTASIDARLIFYPPGELPGNGGGREAMSIQLRGDTPNELSPPRPAVQKCALPAAAKQWAWQRAMPLKLNAELVSVLHQAAVDAHTAFANCDARFFLKFGQAYFADYASAYPGLSAAEREDRFLASFTPRPGDPDWRVAPLDPGRFDFRLCAGGRLVELIDTTFQPILRAESVYYPFPLFVGMLDGHLQMLA